MKAIFFVDTGGFVGSVLRYLISGWLFWFLDKPWFPVGTLAVNLLGCLVTGFLGDIA
jgi:fluoride exporter